MYRNDNHLLVQSNLLHTFVIPDEKSGSSSEMKKIELKLERYEIKNSVTKAKNRMQELTEPFLKEIVWENKSLIRDMETFWTLSWKLWQRKTEYEYLKRFDWLRGKELKPKQVFSLLLK